MDYLAIIGLFLGIYWIIGLLLTINFHTIDEDDRFWLIKIIVLVLLWPLWIWMGQ